MRAVSYAHQQGWQRVQGSAHFRGRVRHAGFRQVAARDHSGRRWGAFLTLLFALAPDSRSVSNGANPTLRAKHQAGRLSLFPRSCDFHPRHANFAHAGEKLLADFCSIRAKPPDLKNPVLQLEWDLADVDGPFLKPTPKGLAHRAAELTCSYTQLAVNVVEKQIRQHYVAWEIPEFWRVSPLRGLRPRNSKKAFLQ